MPSSSSSAAASRDLSPLVLVSECHRCQRGPPPPGLGGCTGDRWSRLLSSKAENETRRGEGEEEAVPGGAATVPVSTSSPLPAHRQTNPAPSPPPALPTTARRASPPLSCSPPSSTADRHPSHRPSSPPRFPLPATSRAHCAVPALLPCRPPNAPAALAALDLLRRQPPARLPCRPSSPTGYWSCSSRQKSERERERKGEERKKRVC